MFKTFLSLGFCVLLVGCGGASCGGGDRPKAPRPSPSAAASPSPPPSLRLRDVLFPAKTCQVVLGRAGAEPLRLDYDVRSVSGGEEVVLTASQGTKTGSQVFVSDSAQLVSRSWVGAEFATPPWFGPHETQSLGVRIKRYDLVAPAERVMTTSESFVGPHGSWSPCITTLWRRDVDRITRIYRTWCRGIGLVREDRTIGKERLIAELQSTTCQSN